MESDDTASSSADSNRYGFKSLERRSYRHNTARKKGRRLQGPGPFLPAASIIKQGVKQQVHISAFSSGNMGLRTVDRPPTPNLFGHLPMSLVKVLSDPSADVQQFARQTTFPSHGPTSFPVCSFNGAAGLASSGSVSWVNAGGIEPGTTPRLASPTAERHLASLLQQLRRERYTEFLFLLHGVEA